MDEVVGVEAIITEIVHEELVDWEILHAVRVEVLELVDGEEEGGFGELIAVEGVFDVADRAHGEGYRRVRSLE